MNRKKLRTLSTTFFVLTLALAAIVAVAAIFASPVSATPRTPAHPFTTCVDASWHAEQSMETFDGGRANNHVTGTLYVLVSAISGPCGPVYVQDAYYLQAQVCSVTGDEEIDQGTTVRFATKVKVNNTNLGCIAGGTFYTYSPTVVISVGSYAAWEVQVGSGNGRWGFYSV